MSPTLVRRLAIVLGLLLIVTGAAYAGSSEWRLATDFEGGPVDFELNWVAAHRLVHREPLYDRAASKQDGLELVGSSFEFSNSGTFASFIGSPATALLLVPFTPFDRALAAALYRVTQALLMAAALAIAGFALPRRCRLPAWLVTLGAVLWYYPVAESIGLGQVDGFVMLALAIAIWASARDRWRLVGVSLGVAALLKVSPVLLILYLVLRGHRKVILPAIASAASLLAVAALVGRPVDLVTWARDVAPEVSKGAYLFTNQSLPGWLARLFGSSSTVAANWQSYDAGIGAWRFLAWAVALGGLAAVYFVRRHRAYVPLELGAVVLVALLAGPITWDHYPTWALLTVLLLADVSWWEHRSWAETVPLAVLGAAGLGAMRAWTPYPPAIGEFVPTWSQRISSGWKTMGMSAFLVVALWLLARPTRAAEGTANSDGASDVETPPEAIGSETARRSRR